MAPRKSATATDVDTLANVQALVGDKLVNLMSGQGTTSDKGAYFQHYFEPLSPTQISYMYRGDWISGKAVDIPAEDETREWRSWKADAVQKTGKKAKQPGSDEDEGEAIKRGARKVVDDLPIPKAGTKPELDKSASQIELLEAEEKRLGLQEKVKLARSMSRLWGGSVLVIGTGGNAEAELKPESIGKGGLKYLLALNRWEIAAGEVNFDLSSPDFGKPKYYELRNEKSSVRIHPSRVVRFIGNRHPDVFSQSSDGWGDSILERARAAVTNAGAVPEIVASLMSEAKIDVVNVKGLSSWLSTPEGTTKLKERFAVAARLKSNQQTLILDSEETFTQKTLNFSQFPELINTYLQIVSGAVDIPVTRFLSTSPKGMNATGESDFRQYYDAVRGRQENELGPLLAPLDEMLIRSALGDRPPEIWYEWNPLWQMSEAEKATMQKTRVETLKGIHDLRVIPTDAFAKGAANAIVELGIMPGLEEALAESEETPDEFAMGEEAAAQIEQKAMQAAQIEKMQSGGEPTLAADGTFFLDLYPEGDTYISDGDPDQPRVPAGNPDGGQWTSEGGGGAAAFNEKLAGGKGGFSSAQRRAIQVAISIYAKRNGSDAGMMLAFAKRKLTEEQIKKILPNLKSAKILSKELDRRQDAAPRTLYVRRNLLNGAAVAKWAKAQGFKQTLDPKDFHVTIAFSRTPLDWMKVSPEWGDDKNGGLIVQAGGPRVVEPLGDKGAIVLHFRSWRLEGRHREIREAGASWDFPEYQPHLTITYSGKGVDLSKVEPYVGPLEFGPEIFEEIFEDWEKSIREVGDSAANPFDAYNPLQPRDPKGTDTGGQWSSGPNSTKRPDPDGYGFKDNPLSETSPSVDKRWRSAWVEYAHPNWRVRGHQRHNGVLKTISRHGQDLDAAKAELDRLVGRA
jgi:phage-related protein (TIGR01555 family)